jgi:hypothetical protein
METFTFPQFPSPYSRIHITLFQNVKNSSTIRQRLIKASTLPDNVEGEKAREKVDFAFLEARLVWPFHAKLTMLMILDDISTSPFDSHPNDLTPLPRRLSNTDDQVA